MAVTVVGAPITTADAYPGAITVSGAATGLIVAVGHSVGFGDASGPSSVSMGGQSLTQIGVAEGAASSGHDVSLSFWALNKAKIAAASNTTLSFSGGNQTGIATAYFTVAGSVDVETLSASGNISTGTTGSVSLARSAGSLTFACSLHDNASLGFSNLANPAEDNEITATNIDFVYGVEVDTARTVDFTWDNLSSRNNSTLALSITASGAASPTVSAADDITSEGDTAEFTLSGNSAAPVSATLNGTSVGTLTLVSGSTYSYTAPLIADDGTADLVISVDSTTASTVISYANSYPYELVTHGEPDANSAFFDTAFATDGPVEWGVVTDFDSGVVVVDWAAMDAAEDELNDIALHSTEVAAGESTATLKYFVPESGATGTFQATATVDGTDETAPTISSASVPTAGNNIAVQMSESMQVGAGGSGGWTISLAGVSVSSASVDGSDDTIINLTPSRTLTDEDTLAIGYTQPGDGFQDQAATPNDLATLSGQAVTNNSTQQPPDVTGPVTQSVGVPTAGTYAIGDDLSFTVNWDEAVTVTGTPALNLDIGGTSRQADYVSGSGSSALVFTYTVQAGDEDDNGIAVSSLTLEDGTLQDASSNNATLTLNSVGDTSGVLVDGLAPVISINSLTTTDTTPVVTGSSGDATSLTLVVNSVTYNPTPSGGTWSQQLPELALDTYPMTLNGQDAAGNDAVEAQAVLTVVDEIVATGNGLFRPLFRANKKSTFKNLFR